MHNDLCFQAERQSSFFLKRMRSIIYLVVFITISTAMVTTRLSWTMIIINRVQTTFGWGLSSQSPNTYFLQPDLACQAIERLLNALFRELSNQEFLPKLPKSCNNYFSFRKVSSWFLITPSRVQKLGFSEWRHFTTVYSLPRASGNESSFIKLISNLFPIAIMEINLVAYHQLLAGVQTKKLANWLWKTWSIWVLKLANFRSSLHRVKVKGAIVDRNFRHSGPLGRRPLIHRIKWKVRVSTGRVVEDNQ